MHEFPDLASGCAHFSLQAVNDLQEKLVEQLQTRSSRSLVMGLQMVSLQKAVTAVGMFSMFEAVMQDKLDCEDGFKRARSLLVERGQAKLGEIFLDYEQAINVLKHGRGRSYDALVAKADTLPFRVKKPSEAFFFEGDVSEVSTLVQVDDQFVLQCAEIIENVYEALREFPEA